jgi:hypothetical protein
VQFSLVQAPGALELRLEEQSLVHGSPTTVLHDPMPVPIAPGAWTDVRLAVVRTAPLVAQARASVAGSADVVTDLTMNVDASTLQLGIGSTFETVPSMGWQTRYDNVRLDIQASAP